MQVIYKGPTGSGKTTELLNRYREIAHRHTTDECLTLLKNATSVSQWRKNIDLKEMGPLHVYTYFGFIQQEMLDYWPYVESELKGGLSRIEPTFMNVETSHFIMSKYVEQNRNRKDTFDYINATSSQIAVQLIDNLNYAAMNCLNFEEMRERLLKWAGDDQEKIMVFNEALLIMKTFREFCLKNRMLDYSLLIDLYNNYLLNHDEYKEILYKRYNYLFVDNLEKTVPATQQLISIINESMERTYLTFNPEEGINRFFGGNPVLAKKTFFPQSEIKRLDTSYTSSSQARKLAGQLKESIFQGERIADPGYIKGEIDTELRGEMLTKTAEKVLDLIDQGIPPGEIALIAPKIDKVMEFTLQHYFEERGYELHNLKHSRRLVDIPFAQALITLALLSYPEWDHWVEYSALQQTLSLVLKLDPVRAALLAEKIFKNGLELVSLDVELRERIGFDRAEKYEYLRNWIKDKQSENLPLDHFFQRVFGELLAPLNPNEDDIMACRQMIDSITKFKTVVKTFKNTDQKGVGEDFIDMIYNGTLAAEVLYKSPLEKDQIILSTPYQFLFTPQLDKVSYLFWLDISSQNWLRSIAKELSNPFIFSPQWEKEKKWDDKIDQELRQKQLVDFLQSILSKSKKGLYLVDSYLDSRGWEQEGRLYEWLSWKGRRGD